MNLAKWYESPKKNRFYVPALYKEMARKAVQKGHCKSMVDFWKEAATNYIVMLEGKGALKPMDREIRQKRAAEKRERRAS